MIRSAREWRDLPKDTPIEEPLDPVRLIPRNAKSQILHFATVPVAKWLKRSPREREVVGSIPGRDKKVFKTGSSGFPPWRSWLWE